MSTLHVWGDRLWMSLLDRDGSWHGRLSDAGTFQRFNAAEDDEYRLDLHTALFSAAEDARWATDPRGLRAAAGSINHPHIVQHVEWLERFPVTPGWELEGRYLRERTLSARRDYVQPGVFWTPGAGGSWELGATMGLHFFKASADAELVLTRVWRGATGVRGRVDARVAALDAFNDLIFQGLGVDPEDAEAHFDYRVQPLALRLDGVWMTEAVRFEVRAGVSRRSRVRVTFPSTGDAPYDLSERLLFAGGMVEIHAGSTTTGAAHATFARADTERLADSPSSLDLMLQEVTWDAGLRLRQRVAPNLSIEADALWTRRPEERRVGWRQRAVTSTGQLQHDREWFGSAALVRRPQSGWTGRLLVGALERSADPPREHLGASNQRLVLDAGYRFVTGFEVVGGLRWDLDGFSERAFDGAQLRISTGRR